MLKSQFVSVTQESGHQGRDYEGGYNNFIVKNYVVAVMGKLTPTTIFKEWNSN